MTDRELDALVAEKVMRWIRDPLQPDSHWLDPICQALPLEQRPTTKYIFRVGVMDRFSTDISAAWQVMEKLKDRVGDKERELLEVNWLPAKNKWVAGIWCYEQKMLGGSVARASFVASADSAPRAICLAALKAFGVEVPAA